MSEWLQRKYILLLSNTLDKFKEKNGTFNCRCPICGDSQKDKHKARGYFLSKQGEYKYFCHNCGATRTIENFLKEIAPNLVQEYKLEVLKESNEFSRQSKEVYGDSMPDIPSSKPDFGSINKKPFKELKAISQLHQDHSAVKYIRSRRIPNEYHYKLYYVENGYEWAKKWLPEKFQSDFKGKDPRIVMPMCDSKNKCFGAVARGIKSTQQRYLKMIWSDDSGFVYGLESIDTKDTIYVFEGQFDSMFIPNSIAVGSMHFDLIKKHLPDQDVVIVLDNEPRSPGTVSQLNKAVDKGYKVCVWPSHIEQKDVNDMVLSGMEPADIKLIIDTNTHSNLKAKLAITAWKK